MELLFKKNVCPCLNWTARDLQIQEQTQEVKLPDSMPDAGRILAGWGQCVLRSKEWRGSGMNISGGVMTWTLYEPEDKSDPVCVEAWVPFQMKWDFPPTEREGKMQAACFLRAVDARVVSARRLIVRVNVGVMGEAMESKELYLYHPESVEADVQLLKRTYPMDLPKEAGEKVFLIDETLSMPASCPVMNRLISYEIFPEVLDQKVVGERVIFRGNARLHMLYSTEEGRLQCWDFEVPFSQFTELDQEYGPEASVQFVLAVTSLELDVEEDGQLHLKCGMAAQYVVSDRVMVELVEDAYSPIRTVELQRESLTLPAMLDQRREVCHSEQNVDQTGAQVADVAFWPDFPVLNRSGDTVQIEFPGTVQVLYYDENGALQGELVHSREGRELAADPAAGMHLLCGTPAAPQTIASSTGILIKTDMAVEVQTVSENGIPMVTGLELGECMEPDPDRPSLILRRAGDEALWEIAKRSGSTVEAIRQANDLQAEPASDRILLIPVP